MKGTEMKKMMLVAGLLCAGAVTAGTASGRNENRSPSAVSAGSSAAAPKKRAQASANLVPQNSVENRSAALSVIFI